MKRDAVLESLTFIGESASGAERSAGAPRAHICTVEAHYCFSCVLVSIHPKFVTAKFGSVGTFFNAAVEHLPPPLDHAEYHHFWLEHWYLRPMSPGKGVFGFVFLPQRLFQSLTHLVRRVETFFAAISHSGTCLYTCRNLRSL